MSAIMLASKAAPILLGSSTKVSSNSRNWRPAWAVTPLLEGN